MEQIQDAFLADYLSMQVRLEEAEARLETLRVLGLAIKRERQILAERLDRIAKIERNTPLGSPVCGGSQGGSA
jgi:hypothetical protein